MVLWHLSASYGDEASLAAIILAEAERWRLKPKNAALGPIESTK